MKRVLPYHLSVPIEGVADDLLHRINSIFGDLNWAWEHLRDFALDERGGVGIGYPKKSLRDARGGSEELVTALREHRNRITDDASLRRHGQVISAIEGFDFKIVSALVVLLGSRRQM